MWTLYASVALILAMPGLAQVFTPGPAQPQAWSLSASERRVLLNAVQKATGEHRPNLLEDFSVSPRRLTEKGPPAIFAVSQYFGCGVHPNCILLVFRRESGNDIPILNTAAGAYDLLGSRHMGYHDLLLQTYQGIHTMVSVWRYDGRQYRVYACTDRSSDGTNSNVSTEHCG